jgi:methionyl-tRNA formyltransferase
VRVVLCTSGGCFGALVLQQLLASPGCEVVGVVRSTRVLRPRYGWLQGALAQVRLSGWRYAAYLGAVSTLAELPAAGGALPGLHAQAAASGLPLLSTRDLNQPPGQDWLRRLRPDLLVSGFFNQRLDDATCALARAGAVNIHPSLLPRDKGVDPVFFGRLRGAERFGVSVHRVVAALDAGPVLAQRVVAAASDDSVFRLTARLFQQGAQLLTGQLDAILNGACGTPQAGEGNYDSWPTPAEVAALRRRGVALLRFRDLLELRRGRLLAPTA